MDITINERRNSEGVRNDRTENTESEKNSSDAEDLHEVRAQ